MKIKVCGTRDKENLENILELKPDFVGFIFYDKSPRFVSEIPLISWPEKVKKVGVFVNEHIDKIAEIAELYHLDYIQLHGDETPEDCKAVKGLNLGVIKAFNVGEDFNFFSLEPFKEFVDYFLFDSVTANRGGSGQTFNWDLLKRYDQQVPFFLSGGIGPMHAEAMKSDWVQQFHPYALDINSKFESAPGMKNIAWLSRFINEIRN